MRTDGDWLGMKVTQGTVLFVTSEDDRKDVNLNLRAILKAEGKSLAHCAEPICPVARRPRRLSRRRVEQTRAARRHAALARAGQADRASQAAPPHPRRAGRPIRRRRERPPPRARLHRPAQAAGDPAEARGPADRPSFAHRHEHRQRTLSGSTDWHNGPRARLYFEQPKDKDDKITRRRRRAPSPSRKSSMRDRERCFACAARRRSSSTKARSGGGAPFDRAAAAAKAESVFLAPLANLRNPRPQRFAEPRFELRAVRLRERTRRPEHHQEGVRKRHVEVAQSEPHPH